MMNCEHNIENNATRDSVILLLRGLEQSKESLRPIVNRLNNEGFDVLVYDRSISIDPLLETVRIANQW